MEEMLTTAEVVKYLRVTKKTLFKLIAEGRIRALKVGNMYRFKKSELEEDLRTNKN